MDTESPKDGWSALHWASFNGDVPLCNRLLEMGASINHLDKSGCNALDKAVLRGMKGVVKVLVAHGATLSPAAKKYFLLLRTPSKMEATQLFSWGAGPD